MADPTQTPSDFGSTLVTGVAGFIGFHVADALLRRGRAVYGIDNMSDYYDVTLKEARVARLVETLSAIDPGDAVKAAFREGRAHMVGTSGTVTSLAGVHMGLPRYERAKVDGYWFDVGDCRAVLGRLLAQRPDERAANACIGKDRADLVVAGGAILDAVLRVWPVRRIRVADRGLREGVLMRLMAAHAR